ncbi:MAG: RMD1 family protein [Gammaproteobacteria bacterium]|nr:RMD1 family protein [Gammaproteobacteria bacterium]
MSTPVSQLHCSSYCLAKHFDFESLKHDFSKRYRTTLYRDVLYIDYEGDAFVFEFGVVVLWNLDHDSESRLLDALEPFRVQPLEYTLGDDFSYRVHAGKNHIAQDHIELKDADTMSLLAVSYGIAQSVELNELENSAEQTIADTASIPRNIARSGNSKLRSRDIAKMRGRLFLVQSDINLHHALMETPDFFWEYPELEELYLMTAKYLEVRNRTEILNKKLSVIHDIFDMLSDEQKHKHSSILEWIIIWLIAFEIVVFLFHDMFGLV